MTVYVTILNLSKFNAENIRDKAMLHLVDSDDCFYGDYEKRLEMTMKELLQDVCIFSKETYIGLTTCTELLTENDLKQFLLNQGATGDSLEQLIESCYSLAQHSLENFQDCVGKIIYRKKQDDSCCTKCNKPSNAFTDYNFFS